MSNLSQTVHILLTARGVDLKGNVDDLTTMINQGVIKVEKAARREALEETKSVLSVMLAGTSNPVEAIEIMFKSINYLLEAE